MCSESQGIHSTNAGGAADDLSDGANGSSCEELRDPQSQGPSQSYSPPPRDRSAALSDQALLSGTVVEVFSTEQFNQTVRRIHNLGGHITVLQSPRQKDAFLWQMRYHFPKRELKQANLV